jgi:ferredoxin-NADP reductase/MOSC domain-containing protein YiiM
LTIAEEAVAARLLSVNVGLPRDIAWQGRTVRTAIWKAPVKGRRFVRRLNIDGDGQGDLKGHGGEHRAVFVYQTDSYRHWQTELKRSDFTYGQFGENFTVEGLSDQEVCIGDRYRIGGALFEVTQPRVTCYRVGIRMNEPRMPALLVTHDRPGFYLRVLEEGEVGEGDVVVQVAAGPERMSVSEINALLYKPGHDRSELERALRIPALSEGWRGSFRELLQQQRKAGGAMGNAALAPAQVPLAWAGFRSMQVVRKLPESSNVVSLTLEPVDGGPLAAALPGQFVVLRLRPASNVPPLIRSYSLSGKPGLACYRLSVKREAHGLAGSYIDEQLRIGDVVEVSAARGAFTLRPGDGPVVLLSAGIGATPVLAMLHALAAEASPRQIWWLHGARNRREHAFAEESRALVEHLANGHRHVRYSLPDPGDRAGVDFHAQGRLNVSVVEELGVPSDADFYVCGPATFMRDLTAGLGGWGIPTDRIRSETFGAGPSITPGVTTSPSRSPHLPPGPPASGPLVSFARSGIDVHWGGGFASVLELAEACDIPARWSCRMGVCHTCETGLVAGMVRYRPDPIDAPAEGNVLICCCQPEANIVIDL